jgi:hypothetical protein
MHPLQPIRASVDALAWLAGRWVGDDEDARFEETWSEPRDGVMLGMFRLFRDGAPRFYELLALAGEEDRLVFRFRHFDPELVGWEERAAPLIFDLVQLEGGGAVFSERDRAPARWMTYRRDEGDGLVVAFATDAGPAADEFRFVRG